MRLRGCAGCRIGVGRACGGCCRAAGAGCASGCRPCWAIGVGRTAGGAAVRCGLGACAGLATGGAGRGPAGADLSASGGGIMVVFPSPSLDLAFFLSRPPSAATSMKITAIIPWMASESMARMSAEFCTIIPPTMFLFFEPHPLGCGPPRGIRLPHSVRSLKAAAQEYSSGNSVAITDDLIHPAPMPILASCLRVC